MHFISKIDHKFTYAYISFPGELILKDLPIYQRPCKINEPEVEKIIFQKIRNEMSQFKFNLNCC